MRRAIKVAIIAVVAGAYGGAMFFVMATRSGDEDSRWQRTVGRLAPRRARSSGDRSVGTAPAFPPFGAGGFETGGYATAARFTGPIADRGSIEQVRKAFATRARRGLADQMAELERLPVATSDPTFSRLRVQGSIVFLLMYQGRFAEAAQWAERAISENPGAPPELRANLEALVGVIHLRRGETENCLECRGPSSCIFPIVAEAVHQKPSGSRAAVAHFTSYLRQRPDDLGVRWLLNVAYMTLGEYPDKVPPEWRMPTDSARSRPDIGRFENVAPDAGLNIRGPNMAGGSIFDDFTGDGRPDVFTTAFDVDLGASLFVNRGDGTFDDRSGPSGLEAQPLAVNCSQADFDNDGRLDVILVRGGWESAARLTLLRNTGDGRFQDVTVAAGLGEPIAAHSAAWGDFDNDGWVDLYVCGEYATSSEGGLFGSDASLIPDDPRNHGRLYRNNGDGTFTDVAGRAGVRNDRYAKAAAWGDIDNDGDPDLYVSNFGAPGRLYRNNGDGTFTDVARELGLNGPVVGFSCGFLDFDNDGRLDLFVIDYAGTLLEWAAGTFGRADLVGPAHPRLYRNDGASGFRDISTTAGLVRPALAMGMGMGDIDNDGFLDIYLGTGRPDFAALMPNVLYKNVEGRRFEDVTTATGTGHLQKGHGVSMADYDADGDLDFFVEVGGAVPGDKAHNLLFRNPGNGRHWLNVKLVGARSNRAAIGARLRADFTARDGSKRSVHRQIGATSSYGGSSLVEHVGLGDALIVDELTISWPTSATTQVFRRIPADGAIEVTEGDATYQVKERPRTTSTRKP